MDSSEVGFVVPIPTSPSTAKLSTDVTAVSIVVVVPLTVRFPVTVASPLTPRLPVTLAPVDIACTFTLLPSLIALESIPVSAEPSPLNDVAVTTPVTVAPLGKSGAPVPALSRILSLEYRH